MVKSYLWDKLSSLKNITTENVKGYRKHYEKHRDKHDNKDQHLSRKMSKDIGKTSDKERNTYPINIWKGVHLHY